MKTGITDSTITCGVKKVALGSLTLAVLLPELTTSIILPV